MKLEPISTFLFARAIKHFKKCQIFPKNDACYSFPRLKSRGTFSRLFCTPEPDRRYETKSVSHIHLGKGPQITFGEEALYKNLEYDLSRLKGANLIFLLPVELIGKNARLPVGARGNS